MFRLNFARLLESLCQLLFINVSSDHAALSLPAHQECCMILHHIVTVISIRCFVVACTWRCHSAQAFFEYCRAILRLWIGIIQVLAFQYQRWKVNNMSHRKPVLNTVCIIIITICITHTYIIDSVRFIENNKHILSYLSRSFLLIPYVASSHTLLRLFQPMPSLYNACHYIVHQSFPTELALHE